ncbi:hypothetical protein BAE44_0005064, partial [Dichanthelium oligosanthes]
MAPARVVPEVPSQPPAARLPCLAAPKVVAKAPSQSPRPGPALSRPELTAVKALMFPCLAALWFGGASAAAVAVTVAVHPEADAGPLLFVASVGAILFAALLAKVVFLLLLRAALRDADSNLEV